MQIAKLITAALLTACLVWALPACTTKEETPDPVVDETATYATASRRAMMKLGIALKTKLESAMAEGGIIGALTVCNVEAVPIAETISIEEGMLVGRTSLRTRNPRNTPDDWERATLDEFAARHEQGENIKKLEAWTISEDTEGHRTFRYMKAIPTAAPCLSCHGAAVETEVAAKIAELYPEDTAMGYAEDDIRGAFTISKPLD